MRHRSPVSQWSARPAARNGLAFLSFAAAVGRRWPGLAETALAAAYDWVGTGLLDDEFPTVARRRRMCRGLSA